MKKIDKESKIYELLIWTLLLSILAFGLFSYFNNFGSNENPSPISDLILFIIVISSVIFNIILIWRR